MCLHLGGSCYISQNAQAEVTMARAHYFTFPKKMTPLMLLSFCLLGPLTPSKISVTFQSPL